MDYYQIPGVKPYKAAELILQLLLAGLSFSSPGTLSIFTSPTWVKHICLQILSTPEVENLRWNLFGKILGDEALQKPSASLESAFLPSGLLVGLSLEKGDNLFLGL